MKWATGGFLVGFILCYLLLAFPSQPPRAAGLVGSATPSITPPSSQVTFVVTNIQLPEIRIPMTDRWLDQGPGTPPGPGYSLDLIDTRFQPPPLQDRL
jgi:hypothetical protein